MMLSCEQFEILLADSIDGELNAPARAADRAAFEQHLAGCAACAELAADARSAVSLLDIAADVEPPPVLVAKILHETKSGWELGLQAKGARGWLNRFFAPVLQPRLVMGAMLTLMSVTMLSRCGAAPKRSLSAADLDPVRLWTSLDDRSHRIVDRAMKSYESMRLVYEIRSQIDDWKQKQADEEEAAAEKRAATKEIKPVTAGDSRRGEKQEKQ